MEITSPPSFLLLILLAIGLAWWAGYRSRFKKIPGIKQSFDQEYFIGLNYLLNDEPDDAIDLFIDALELSSDTLETHLALCTLLRRRGAVDRAINQSQFLLNNQKFTLIQTGEIKLNLVRSYIAAGLFDRAEQMLRELNSASPQIREAALGLAMTVFQMEKDWKQALSAAMELLTICPAVKRPELQMQSSHYYCELAEVALNHNDLQSARAELQNALQITRNNVRVYLLLGSIEALTGNFQEAVRILQKVVQYDPSFASEATAGLLENMQKAGMENQISWMLEGGQTENLGFRQFQEIVSNIQKSQGDAAALALLQRHLYKNPSLAVLAQIFAYAAKSSVQEQSAVLEIGTAFLNMHLHHSPNYRCENCGFELKNLHWLCPSCSKWGIVKPIEGKFTFH